MSDVRISDLLGEIDQYKYNPAAIQRVALNALRKASDGQIDIVDPTSPFVYCLENTAVNTAAFMRATAAATRRAYPAAASDQDDVYLHMSDRDYSGRFAKPTSATFTILLSKEELLHQLQPDSSGNFSKVVVPRNTIFRVGETDFSLQYPIEIRRFTHGGFQVVYVRDRESPLQSLTTNLIEWFDVQLNEEQSFIRFDVLAQQFFIESVYNDVSTVSGQRTEISLQDQFYYARIYHMNQQNVWVEMKTTYTSKIYNPEELTAVIRTYDDRIVVTIPPIYTMNNMVRGKLRIDVYQTKGDVAMELANYTLDDFSVNWLNVDTNDDDVYVSGVRNIRTLSVMSRTSVSGGRNALSFQDLKQRVLQNAIGAQNLPITNVQIETSIVDLGYAIVRQIDTLTNRIYLASKAVTPPVDQKINTAASSSMCQISVSLKEASFAYGAYTNQLSVTLTSRSVYQVSSGITKPITVEAFEALDALPIAQRAKVISDEGYFYSPFTYVLDANDNVFEVRPYHLDTPSVIWKNFVAENASTGYQVSVSANHQIDKTDSGYVIRILTDSTVFFRELPDENVFAQLAMRSINQDVMVYLNGVLKYKNAQGERLYEFVLDTNYYVDSNNYIEITTLTSKSNGLIVKAGLEQDFEVFFLTNAPMPQSFSPSAMDEKIDSTILPAGVVAVTHETIRFKFGTALKALWASSRSAVTSIPYKVYSTNVVARYEHDVYEVDPLTGLSFKVGPTGSLEYNKLANRGDIKYDPQGNVVFEHLKGEAVLDEHNQPVPVDGFEMYMIRYVDVYMLEGVYYFATDSVSNNYKALIIEHLLKWIGVDMPQYTNSLLDQTKIYFYPRVNVGMIKVIASNNDQVVIDSEQVLKVRLSVPPSTYADLSLREELQRLTILTIDEQFKRQSVSVSAIEYALRDAYNDDVYDVEITGMGGAYKLNQITVVEDHSRLSIKKKLTPLADGKLIVEEDIAIEFIQHGADN